VFYFALKFSMVSVILISDNILFLCKRVKVGQNVAELSSLATKNYPGTISEPHCY